MSEHETSFQADEIVEDLLPVDLDWRHLVRSYPICAMTVAAAGGFLVGRRHGLSLLRDLSSFVTDEVSRNVQAFFEGGGPPRDSPDA